MWGQGIGGRNEWPRDPWMGRAGRSQALPFHRTVGNANTGVVLVASGMSRASYARELTLTPPESARFDDKLQKPNLLCYSTRAGRETRRGGCNGKSYFDRERTGRSASTTHRALIRSLRDGMMAGCLAGFPPRGGARTGRPERQHALLAWHDCVLSRVVILVARHTG